MSNPPHEFSCWYQMVIYLPLSLEDNTDLSKVKEDAKVVIRNALDNLLMTRELFH